MWMQNTNWLLKWWNCTETRVYLKKVSLSLLILVTALSGKPLIFGRKRLWASGELKIGNIDSSHLYGERESVREKERERKGGSILREVDSILAIICLFLVLGRVNGFDFCTATYYCRAIWESSGGRQGSHGHTHTHTNAKNNSIHWENTYASSQVNVQFRHISAL